jgi:hypothetical protein
MEVEDLVHYYPHLYHMAEKGSWESIRRRGLLSTSSLLDLFEYSGDERTQLEAKRRPEIVTITHSTYGHAVIRDQKPMTDADLQRCLRDLTPREWYVLLNQRVFFWLSRDRLLRLLGARAYRNRLHDVLTVDTRALIERHQDKVTLSPINSGCTKPSPQPRGLDTFLPISEYPFDYWRKKRSGIKNAVVELAARGEVQDIKDLVTRVETMHGNDIVELIHKR